MFLEGRSLEFCKQGSAVSVQVNGRTVKATALSNINHSNVSLTQDKAGRWFALDIIQQQQKQQRTGRSLHIKKQGQPDKLKVEWQTLFVSGKRTHEPPPGSFLTGYVESPFYRNGNKLIMPNDLRIETHAVNYFHAIATVFTSKPRAMMLFIKSSISHRNGGFFLISKTAKGDRSNEFPPIDPNQEFPPDYGSVTFPQDAELFLDARSGNVTGQSPPTQLFWSAIDAFPGMTNYTELGSTFSSIGFTHHDETQLPPIGTTDTWRSNFFARKPPSGERQSLLQKTISSGFTTVFFGGFFAVNTFRTDLDPNDPVLTGNTQIELSFIR